MALKTILCHGSERRGGLSTVNKLLAAEGYRTKDPSILYARATFFSVEVVM